MLAKALKSCPKFNKSPHLVTLLESNRHEKSIFLVLGDRALQLEIKSFMVFIKGLQVQELETSSGTGFWLEVALRDVGDGHGDDSGGRDLDDVMHRPLPDVQGVH